MRTDKPEARFCTKCGNTYENFCVTCFRRDRRETVMSLLRKYGLDDDNLIQALANMVKEGHFPALSKAIDLAEMKPVQQIEASGPGGGPIQLEDARNAVPDIISRLAAARRKGEDNSGDGTG